MHTEAAVLQQGRCADAVRDAVRWLVQSGVQETVGPEAGAFWSWVDPVRPRFRYSEVTGYAVTLFCYLHRRDPASGSLGRARLAARWLMDRAREGDAIRCRLGPGGWVGHLCAFDNAQVVHAFCSLYELTQEEEYLAAARRTADWLMDVAGIGSASCIPKFDPGTGSPVLGDRWSTQTGPFLAKAMLALLHLGRLCSGSRYLEAAEAVGEWVMGRQLPHGRFVTDHLTGDTYLHAHCYALEGLACLGTVTGRTSAMEAARLGLRWAYTTQNADGGLPARYDPHGSCSEEHSDSLAQTLRLELWLHGPGPRADHLASRLTDFQCRGPSPDRLGGFLYRRNGGEFDPNITTHGTIFAIQALDMYSRSCRGFAWSDLV